MFAGITTVDGADLWTTYGGVILEGGYDEVVCLPPTKAVEYNDWFEEDGIETDLSSLVFDAKAADIAMAFPNDGDGLERFVAAMNEGPYHLFTFGELGGAEYTLRPVSTTSMTTTAPRCLTLRYNIDAGPLPDGYQYVTPGSSVVAPCSDYTLDGRPLTDYGINVLVGSLAEIQKEPEVKAALTRDIRTNTGIFYDPDAPVRRGSKDVTIRCLMRAATMAEFWKNYRALCYDLTRSNARALYVAATDTTYSCFYKSCNTNEFHPTRKIWFDFSLTLTFIDGK